ncbi:haloacid dehalogenase type II [Pseudomonas huanghezhanensis]|uniref:haloacid dehalogenase type II n=1 Tax=Pseudomonas huanghezhanensis TaxID=3002903 RepID=UPI002286AABC|nr:haloacid dehalogenase type II [Pseudomonas sp. BSw22131]
MAKQRFAPILVFDVNETLLDITTLDPFFERVFGDRAILREWFAQLILYSQTMTLCGRYVPFGELAVGTLRMLGSIYQVTINVSDIDELKARMNTMPAHPDVLPALNLLKDAGFRLVTLSNSGSGASPSALEGAGLSKFFERRFSVEAVRKFKPAPETYQMVARDLNVEMSDLLLVACHLWDTAGAQAAGCLGALLTRPHNALLPVIEVPEPDLVAVDLTGLTKKIIERWVGL